MIFHWKKKIYLPNVFHLAATFVDESLFQKVVCIHFPSFFCSLFIRFWYDIYFPELFFQSYFEATFYYLPSPSASFAEFLLCMDVVHEYSMLHESWTPGSGSFLPKPQQCTQLEHEGSRLDDEGQKWNCVDKEWFLWNCTQTYDDNYMDWYD